MQTAAAQPLTTRTRRRNADAPPAAVYEDANMPPRKMRAPRRHVNGNAQSPRDANAAAAQCGWPAQPQRYTPHTATDVNVPRSPARFELQPRSSRATRMPRRRNADAPAQPSATPRPPPPMNANIIHWPMRMQMRPRRCFRARLRRRFRAHFTVYEFLYNMCCNTHRPPPLAPREEALATSTSGLPSEAPPEELTSASASYSDGGV
ncbi:hypothetical protein B0H13DRAFT_2334661 [Mycena leptocephala]|nr:hypothetical protein B0H13DRAFT_2334661 [Mycena leptocephala]